MKEIGKRNKFRIIAALLAVVMMLAAGCAKGSATDSTLVAEINGSKIYIDEARFYAYMEQANYEAYYLAYGQTVDWSAQFTDSDSGEATTLENIVKDESLDIILKQKLFLQLAEEWDITLTEEDLAQVEKDAAAFFEDSDKDLLERIGAEEEMVKRIYREVSIYVKVCEKLLAENPVTVEESEYHQGLFTVAIVDPEVITSAEDTAKAVLGRVQSGENLTYVADKYGLEATTGNVGKGDFSGNELETAMLEMKTGDSAYVLCENYYYVIYCEDDDDEEATEIAKEALIDEKEAEYITEYYENLKESADVKIYTKVYDTIKYDKVIFTEDDMEEVTTTSEATTSEETTTEETTSVE